MCHGQNQPLNRVQRCISALHCPTRWRIIQCIGTEERSTKEIFEQLGLGDGMSMAGLYYHLSALKGARSSKLPLIERSKAALLRRCGG
jgi:DNA-binding transcriptional ArsR family regulator